MKKNNIKETFKKIEKKNPHASSFIVFAKTIRSKKLTEKTVRNFFWKLVDREDYTKKDAKYLIPFLMNLTTLPRG